MSQETEDNKNIAQIVAMLNKTQCNVEPAMGTSLYMREVTNLSDFGFACIVTECVPSRYLRLRALRRLEEKITNVIVLEQIAKYLADDKYWDSQIADNLAFELQKIKNKQKCKRCKYRIGNGSTCLRVGRCYKPMRIRLRHFWWKISNPFRKIKFGIHKRRR